MHQITLDQDLNTARQHLLGGNTALAIRLLVELEQAHQDDALALQHVAELYVASSQHAAAARCHQRAAELAPDSPQAVYNLASSMIAMGELAAAETLLDRVIFLAPHDHDAWYNRSTLRTQTPDANHVDALRFVLQHLAPEDPGRVPLCYALAKELEDLGQHAESFRVLQEGAAARRRRLDYEVASDETAMAAIARAFSADVLDRSPGLHTPDQPVFIIGLPRSGTTLVDRIIGSHSQVESLGEVNTLALAVVNEAGHLASKAGLIERATRLDFAALAKRYRDGTDGFGYDAPRLLDKTPLNFLYLGLIHLALPGARVIHLRRHPLDSCYAMYKTLFRMGYPFSYSLQDVGRYYLAYHRLMGHWRACIPGAFLDVDYEALVADPRGQTERMLDYLGLDWEDRCLDFHSRPGAAATASAAQVRQPIYGSSVHKWKHYAEQLTPLGQQLALRGVHVET